MIRGIVIARAALVPCRIRGPLGETEVEARLDTGFDGYLTLPAPLISNLGLAPSGPRPSVVADGRRVMLATFGAEALWHGGWIDITVVESSVEPLLGMSLLYGSELRLRAIGGGDVTISPLDALPA